MVRIVCILLFGCVLAFGQAFTLQDTAFLGNAIPTVSGVTLSPTNLPNAVSISWWKASDYTTNAGVPTLPDSGLGGYALTNRYGDVNWPVSDGTLNGISVMQFIYDLSFMGCVNYTSSQPHTICLIIKDEAFDNTGKFYFDSASAGARNYLFSTTAGQPKKMTMDSGTEVYYTYLNTNIWVLVECLFNDTTSQMWTNGVSSAAASAGGSSAISGFNLNGGFNHGNAAAFHFAEAMTYSSVFTASDRNYLSNYVRGKYGPGNVVP